MDITHQDSGTLENAAQQVKRGAGKLADSAADAASTAWDGVRRGSGEVRDFAYRRPIETALLSTGTACIIAGLTLLFTRGD